MVCDFFCATGEETLIHFLLECGELGAVRLRHGIGDGVQLSKLVLFRERKEAEIRRTMKFVDELWRV